MNTDEKHSPPNDRLDGWKEISNYLRCDVRTCLRWEKDSELPVSRIGSDGKRSKVIAYKSDLDKWMVRKRNPVSPQPVRRPIGSKAFLVAVPILIALIFVVPRTFPRSAGPVRMELNGQALVAFDAKNNPLWPIAIEAAGDQAPFYTFPSVSYNSKQSRYAFGDIDQDGRNEVAVFLNADNPAARAVALFDNDGDRIWKNDIRFDTTYADAPPGNNFLPMQIEIKNVLGDSRPEILALWRHSRFHPGVFEIFSVNGTSLFHYEHTGVLQSFAMQYYGDGNRVKEILLGGTNNLLGGDAVLVVLDPADLRSGLGPPYLVPVEFVDRKPSLEKYRPLNPRPAVQKHYFRFPHNEVATNDAIPYMNVLEILPSKEGYSIQVQYGESMTPVFSFDSEFRLLDVALGTHLTREYNDFFQRGVLRKPLDQFLDERCKDVWRWNDIAWEKVLSPRR